MSCATTPITRLATTLEGAQVPTAAVPSGAAERLVDTLQAGASVDPTDVWGIDEHVRRARQVIVDLVATGVVPASLDIRHDEPLPVVQRSLLVAWRHVVTVAPA